MQSESVLKLRDVVISALASVVRHMKGNAEVKTYHDEIHVVAQTDTDAGGKLTEE